MEYTIFVWTITSSLLNCAINSEYAIPRKLSYNTTLEGRETSIQSFIDSFYSDLALCGNKSTYKQVKVYKTTSKYCDLTKTSTPLVRSCRRLCGDSDARCAEKCPQYYECTWGVDPNQTEFCDRYYDYPDKWEPTITIPTTGESSQETTETEKTKESVAVEPSTSATVTSERSHGTLTTEQALRQQACEEKLGYTLIRDRDYYALCTGAVLAVVQFTGIMLIGTGCFSGTRRRLRDWSGSRQRSQSGEMNTSGPAPQHSQHSLYLRSNNPLMK